MKRSKVNLALAFMTTVVILSVIGTTAGTLAWYAYATRATLSFSGTSAHASERVRVGIHDINQYLFNSEKISDLRTFANNNDLEIDIDKNIIWGKEGEGLTGSIISYYLDASPYATNELPPVTSLRRTSDSSDPLTLYKAPFALDTTYDRVAPRNYYSKIPLCFEIIGSDGNTVPENNIWLTGISAIDTDVEGLKYALRIFYENKYDNTQYLLSPASDLDTVGSTVLAGTLDLKGDGVYDYDFITKKEIVYGQYENTVDYSATRYVAPNPNPLDDVNNTGETEASTFLAAHENGVYVADLTSIVPATASYETINTIAPTADADGRYSGGKPVGNTGDKIDDNQVHEYIAYTDLTIYLEGWDHAIIDKVINASFNLGLQFEINRL